MREGGRQIKKVNSQCFLGKLGLFVQLDADEIFGNLHVHNNKYAENASIDEIRALAKAVKDLFDLFTCEMG